MRKAASSFRKVLAPIAAGYWYRASTINRSKVDGRIGRGMATATHLGARAIDGLTEASRHFPALRGRSVNVELGNARLARPHPYPRHLIANGRG